MMKPGIQTGNVISLFVFDTFVTSGQPLKDHMMQKHGWSEKQFDEYRSHYLEAFANTDTAAALASLNPGQRDTEQTYEITTKKKGYRVYKLQHGDKWIGFKPLNTYIYLYNPHLFKYMFRRVDPIEAIWFEVEEIVDHSEPVGNIFLTQA